MPITISGSTGIAGVDGSASTPAVQGTDTNTGIFFPAADTIAFGEGGSEVMRIDSSGNVGIGTSSPGSAYRLAVSGNNTGMSIQDTGSVGTWLDFKTGSGTVQGNIYFNFTNGYMTFGTAAAGSSQTERARIDSSGNFLFNSGYGSVATAYGCRAWVNFNGTGTVAIRASGNVTSITDNGTGDYTVNFTNAMPDANYTLSTASNETGSAPQFICLKQSTAPSTGSVRVQARYGTSWSTQDVSYAFVSIIR